MTLEEPIYPLSIGSIVGGGTSENEPWRRAITDLTRHVAKALNGVSTPVRVNIIFQVPGDLFAPDFDGVRTGHFSKKHSLLIVQVALPGDLPPDPHLYIQEAALQAISEAERWAAKRELTADLDALRNVLSSFNTSAS